MARTLKKILKCRLDNPEHIAAIKIMLRNYMSDNMGCSCLPNPSDEKKLLHLLRKHPSVLILFIKYNSVIAGMALAFINISTFSARKMINLHDLIVSPGYRGKGLGKLLMKALIAEAKKLDCSKITLEVRRDNTSALNLYSSFGFSATEPEMKFKVKYL